MIFFVIVIVALNVKCIGNYCGCADFVNQTEQSSLSSNVLHLIGNESVVTLKHFSNAWCHKNKEKIYVAKKTKNCRDLFRMWPDISVSSRVTNVMTIYLKTTQ